MKLAFLRTDNFSQAVSTNVGGSYTHATGFVNGMQRLGHDVIFFASAWPLTGSPDKNKFYHIPYPHFPELLSEASRLLYSYLFVLQALKPLRHEKPDVLYQRHSDFNCSGVMLSKLLNIPLVLEANSSEVWVVENWGKLYLKRLAHLFEDAAFRGAKIITVVSEVLENDLIELGVDSKKIVLNPNGVDIKMFHPNIDGAEVRQKYQLHNEIVVGFVGSFGVWHGVSVLIEAIQHIVKQRQNIHFLLVGDGVLKPQIETKVIESGLEKFVTFTGNISHQMVPQYLAACDILSSPHVPLSGGAAFFGSPTKMFEYMATGKGIVASALGQIGEILQDGKNAVLTEPGNVEEHALAILKLANNPELRGRLGQQAYQDVSSQYTWDKNAERVLSAICSP